GRGTVLAGVVGQLPGVLLPEERRAIVASAEAAQELEALLPAAHLAQVAQLLEQQVRVVGKELQELLHAGQLRYAVGGVGGQGPARMERQPVAGSLRGEHVVRL